VRFRVILHEGVVREDLVPVLARGVRRIGAECFEVAADDVAVEVTRVPAGHLFTAGRPSTSSLVAGTVPPRTPSEQRTELLSRITRLWCDVTGCTPREIVVTALDAPA
jgi:phenylpyruvate tautomerase PptA (4-oxalocrotonate tautomerase family)